MSRQLGRPDVGGWVTFNRGKGPNGLIRTGVGEFPFNPPRRINFRGPGELDWLGFPRNVQGLIFHSEKNVSICEFGGMDAKDIVPMRVSQRASKSNSLPLWYCGLWIADYNHVSYLCSLTEFDGVNAAKQTRFCHRENEAIVLHAEGEGKWR